MSDGAEKATDGGENATGADGNATDAGRSSNADRETDADGWPPMEAARYADGSVVYPVHPIGPDGSEPVETIDLSEYTAEVVTWTTSTATPPGVREPNTLAIVEFSVEGESVRAIGQVTTDEIEIGDEVEPVYAEQLRDPEAGIKEPESQAWDGYRFEPV